MCDYDGIRDRELLNYHNQMSKYAKLGECDWCGDLVDKSELTEEPLDDEAIQQVCHACYSEFKSKERKNNLKYNRI